MEDEVIGFAGVSALVGFVLVGFVDILAYVHTMYV